LRNASILGARNFGLSKLNERASPSLFSHVLFSASYLILKRLILFHNRACGRVVFPKSDDASPVEYYMIGQTAKFAYRLESSFHEDLSVQVLR